MKLLLLTMAVVDHCNYTDCFLSYKDVGWYKNDTKILGISAWVCLLILLFPALVLEVFYICRYKTTFLMRLFFYLTIAGTIVDLNYALTFAALNPLPDKTWLLQMCVWAEISKIAVFHFAMLLELVLIFLINLNLLSKLSKYGCNKQWLVSKKCIFRKRHEVLFVILYHLLCAVFSTALIVTLLYKETEVIRIILYFVPALVDITVSFLSFAVFVAWFFKLRRKHLLKNRLSLVCKEVGLVLAFLILFLLPWSIEAVLVISKNNTIWTNKIADHLYDAVFPVIHATTSLTSFVYICVTICQQRAAGKKELNFQNKATSATAPPSTRVSLPSDTAAHAPNFLSPSTAEPSDTTPLLHGEHAGTRSSHMSGLGTLTIIL